jgi:hypothetical protein
MKLNDKIDEMYMLRERKRGLEAQVKEINDEIALCQEQLIKRCAEVGTTTAKGSLASIVVTKSVLPNIEDWGEVTDWVMANDGIYLLHRRISAGPWRELLDSGETVPGLVPYTKTAIALRKLSD